MFLQLQRMCFIEQKVVVSSDTEEQASSSDQGAVGQLPPRARQRLLRVDTLPRGRLPHAQHTYAGIEAAGTHRSAATPSPRCPPWPGPTHLGCQLSGSAGPWTSHPAGAPAPLATARRPPHSAEERVRGGSPTPALTHSLALTPPVPHLKHRDGPQGLMAPQVPDNADLVPARAGETASSVPESQPWPSPPAKTWVAGH